METTGLIQEKSAIMMDRIALNVYTLILTVATMSKMLEKNVMRIQMIA